MTHHSNTTHHGDAGKQPGKQHSMPDKPRSDMANYIGSGKLSGKAALITGGR